ncbi:MAG TPA: hypothetical protein VIG06_09085 [Kofleriaceae bacterium]|jgi:hypothetical protein
MTRVFFALMSALAVFLLAGAPATMAIAAGDGTAVAQADPKTDDGPAAKVTGEVDVDVDRGGDAWYLSPTWIVIGVLAVGVLVAIIVAASRGGGTTIIRE